MSRSLSVNPTRILVQKLNKTIEAKYAGSNYFDVKMCQHISNIRVIPTLLTNSSIIVNVNGEMIPVNNITRKLNVQPSNATCFAGILIIFNVGDDYEQNGKPLDLVGQVDAEGIVRTDKAKLLEQCSKNSLSDNKKLFTVREWTYVFINYIQTHQFNHNIFDKNRAEQHMKTQERLMISNSTEDVSYSDDMLNSIHFLNVNPPKILEDYEFYPVSTSSKTLYTIPETQSLALGIADLIAEQAYLNNFRTAVDMMITSDYVDNSSSSIDFGNIISSIAHGFGDVVEDGIDAVGKVVHIGTQAVDSLAHTGTGVFDSVGHTLSGTFTELFIPIICIGGFVLVASVVGFIIYKKYMGQNTHKRKKKKKRKYSSSSSSSGSNSNSTDTDSSKKKGDV